MTERDYRQGFKSGDKLMIGEAEAKRKKRKAQVSGGNEAHWWLAKDEDLPRAVLQQVQTIIKNDHGRIAQIHLATRLYGSGSNSPVQTLGPYTGMSMGGAVKSTNPGQYARLGFNIIQAAIDTLVAKLCKNKPMPFFLTSKGDSKLQRKAKGLNDFVKGVFYENDAYNMGRRALRDGCTWPAGITQVYREHGRIKFGRVMPEELLVDYLESHYGMESTRTLHRVRITDRSALAACYPDSADEIAKMIPTADVIVGAYKSTSDSVSVVESWHLPSSPEADDGLHCVTSGDILLYKEKWTRSTFPFAIFRFSEHLNGFWGQSATEQLMPIQLELNRILRTIQQSLYMMGTFKILVHNGSQIVDTHFDNRIGTQVKWAGQIEPKYVTPPAVQPELYQRVPELINMGFNQVGISQMSATSKTDLGPNASGQAYRERDDIETERFQVVGQAYENYYLQLANLAVLEAKELAEELKEQGKKLTFKVPGKKFLDTIEWDKVDMEEDQYSLQCYPISKLPSDPAGRLATIQELIQGGFITQEVGNRLLDFPDLDAEQNLQNAMLDYIHMSLDAICEGGKYRPPEPDDNLQLAMKLAVEYLTVGKRDNLPEDRLNKLRNYIGQVQDLQTAATPPQPALPAAAPANPQPTPTSPLIPNINGANAA